MSKPSKRFVLVKYERSEQMFVLERASWEMYVKAGKDAGHLTSHMVAESDDRAELVRFQKLAEEG